jgi:putative endonuclease
MFVSKPLLTSYVTGLLSEFLAIIVLTLKGYRLLHRRYKTPLGEIDLICLKQSTVIFIEVKKRKTLSTALHSLLPRQQKRILNAARFFLSHYSEQNLNIRFDIIAFNKNWRFTHEKNVLIKGF